MTPSLNRLAPRPSGHLLAGTLLLMSLLWNPGFCATELAIIVNPQSGVDRLTNAEVVHIFLGHQKRLPSGAPALTVDLAGQDRHKADFYAGLIGKELSEISAYWARLIFSGQGSPPVQAESDEEVLEIVKSNRGAIGYVAPDKVDAGVKVVYTLTR